MRLLVTRPEPDGARTAATLRTLGHEVVVAPVLRTEMVAASFGSGPFAALAITSRNAVRAVLSHPRRGELAGLPVFAVGARSADAAREAGFSDVVSADGDAGDLVTLLAGRFSGSGTRLLYLAGEDQVGNLAGVLTACGVMVETAVVYRAVAVKDFPTRLRAAFAAGPLDGVLHYSRRSAQAFLTGAQEADRLRRAVGATHFCLSVDVAMPLTVAGALSVRIAARPDEAALIAALSQP